MWVLFGTGCLYRSDLIHIIENRISIQKVARPDDGFLAVIVNYRQAGPANRFTDAQTIQHMLVKINGKSPAGLIENLPKSPNIMFHSGQDKCIGQSENLILYSCADSPFLGSR